MMAEVELNHPNTSNSKTRTSAEMRRPRSDNMQRSSVPKRQMIVVDVYSNHPVQDCYRRLHNVVKASTFSLV